VAGLGAARDLPQVALPLARRATAALRRRQAMQ
jgi:hypothetical protein